MEEKQWRPVAMPDYAERYQVSDDGCIRSVASGKTLKPGKQSKGYLTVSLYDGSSPKRPRSFLMHRLIAEAFLGPCADDLTVDHIDNNKENNKLSNLRYISRRDNVKRAHDAGLVPYNGAKGDRTQKLTAETAAKLKQELRELTGLRGEKKRLAEEYGISSRTLTDIAAGRVWKNVP